MRQIYILLTETFRRKTGSDFPQGTVLSIPLFVIILTLLSQFFFVQETQAQNYLDKVGLSSTQSIVAYSVRKVSTSYMGSALKVRRSSDNTQQDIGFTAAGDLDQVALLSFVGAGDGFVVTWYDQSGLGRNATQAVAANQPKIVNAGIVYNNGGRAAMKFSSSAQNLGYTFASPTTYSYPVTISLLANTGGVSTNGAFVKFGSDANNSGIAIGIGTSSLTAAGTSVIALKDNGAAPGPSCPSSPIVDYPATPFTSTTSVLNSLTGTPVNTYLNGTSLNLANSTGATKGASIRGSLYIGGFTGTYGGYPMVSESEVIILNSILSTTDREQLECNQVLYYGILTAAAGATQHICSSLNSLPLGGVTPSYGTGRWVQVSGPGTTEFSSEIDGNSTATASQMGTYVYSWEVSNGSCIAAADVTVTYSQPPTVGINQNICGLPRLSNPLGGNTPAVGTGSWSMVSGPGNVTFSDANIGNSTAEVDVDGTYIFRWTVTGEYCSPNYVDVQVAYNSASGARPTGVISGNAAICPGSATNLTVNLTGTAPWHLRYTDGVSVYNLVVNASPYTFAVTPANVSSYTITALSDANCISLPADLTGAAVVSFNPTVTITADYCSLGNGLVKLDAGAHYSWAWSTGATTRTITVSQSGFYSVNVKDAAAGCVSKGSYNVGEELVFNGDFSLGNVGFVTQYQIPTVVKDCPSSTGGLYPEGKFDIQNNAQLTHCNFWGRDHTKGTGTGNANFMIVNGANTLTQIWKTNNIQVEPNTLYYFSAWCLSLNNVPPFAALTFVINGSQVGTTAVLGAGVNSTAGNTGWTRFYGQWNSGTNTSATIAIINTNLANSGNDFGLDDISFSTIPPVTFAANPLGNGGNSFCPGDTLVLTPNLTGGASDITYSWTGPNSFTSTDESPVILLASAAQAGTYSLTATDANGCTATKSISVIGATPAVATISQPSVCTGSSVIINLTGLVPNSINNTLYFKVTSGGAKRTVTGVNANAAGNASFIATGLTSANSGQIFYLDSIFNGSCTQTLSLTLTLSIKAVGWVGGTSGNWTVASNWCPGLPTTTTDVSIPTGTTIYINTSDIAYCRNISLVGTGNLVVDKGLLRISGTITTAGTGRINAATGIIETNAGAAQTLAGNNFVGNNIGVLQLSNTSNTTVTISSTGDSLRVLSALLFGNTTADLTTNDKLIIGSNDTATARVGVVAAGNIIIGNAAVERYFPSQRSWRLITAPLSNAGSIFNNWQNGGVYKAGRGTLITGPNPSGSNGLDASPLNTTSLKAGVNLTDVGNTKSMNLSNNSGNADNLAYFLFVRGDRNPANTNPNNSNTTTLSSTGKLQTGTQTFIASAVKDGFTLIGNPYASPVYFRSLSRTNLVNRFVIWDPYLNQVGGYVYVEDPLNIGTYTYTPSRPGGQDSVIQSSQAFYVQTAANGPASLVFNEANKWTKGNGGVFRPVNPVTTTSRASASLRVNLMSVNGNKAPVLADGVYVEFDDKWDAGIDAFDGYKFTNVNEMLSIKHAANLLAVERRPAIISADTLFLGVDKLGRHGYTLEFLPVNLDTSLQVFLEDSYTGITSLLSVVGASTVDFVVDNNPASASADRFRITFKYAGIPPLSFRHLKASPNRAGISVDWTVQNEMAIRNYDIERSQDGDHFASIGTTDAAGVGTKDIAYNWLDKTPYKGTNFYRIRSTGINGKIVYSNVVKVVLEKESSGISVYPNPVTGNTIGLQFRDTPSGMYRLRLIDAKGQVVVARQLNHTAGISLEKIRLETKPAAGFYQLELTSAERNISVIQLIVE